MRIITKQEYQCEKCLATYDLATDATHCESREIQRSGVNLGDVVRIEYGMSSGCRAEVTQIVVRPQTSAGHYEKDILWHTEELVVKVIDDCCNKGLSCVVNCFDYKKV